MIDITRRNFLRGAAVTMALPLLEWMQDLQAAEKNSVYTKRMLCVGNDYGYYPEEFFPKNTGLNYKMPKLIQPMAQHRNKMTIFSGLDHTGVNGGHDAACSYLTAVDTKGFPGVNFKNTISIDQLAADTFGLSTRFPSIQLSFRTSKGGLSWTKYGMTLRPIINPAELFDVMFRNASPSEKSLEKKKLDKKKSVLDAIMSDASDLNRKLGKYDKEKLDEYLTSVREVEKALRVNKAWIDKQKPKTSVKAPKKITAYKADFFEVLPVMYDLITLAFQTNSTRYISLQIPTVTRGKLPGVRESYHGLSHHGKSPDKIKQLLILELLQSKEFARFLGKMASIKQFGKSLLDDTICLYGGGMGNASSHSNRNLPNLIVGGGFKHKGHLNYTGKQVPLGNLYVTILQKLGLEVDKFGISSGRINGFG